MLFAAFTVCRSKMPPCVHSKRLSVYPEHVLSCLEHMHVLRAHAETISAYCRRRFESTHGEKRCGWEGVNVTHQTNTNTTHCIPNQQHYPNHCTPTPLPTTHNITHQRHCPHTPTLHTSHTNTQRLTIHRADVSLDVACFVRGSAYNEGSKNYCKCTGNVG